MEKNRRYVAAMQYVAMRNQVVASGASPDTDIAVLLQNSRRWTAAQVWARIWHLFFYSGMKTKFARQRADGAIAGGWFADFRAIAGADQNPDHAWRVAKVRTAGRGKRPGQGCKPVGSEAKAFCMRCGVYSSMPYRTGAKVVHRITRLADLFVSMEELAASSNTSVVDVLAGGSATGPDGLNRAFETLRPVTGPITALHALSDLGFACHKPDIWMCRIASWLGWTPDHSEDDLISNRCDGWEILRKNCILTSAEAARSGLLKKELNPLRSLDWYVSRYGMLFKPSSAAHLLQLVSDSGPQSPKPHQPAVILPSTPKCGWARA